MRTTRELDEILAEIALKHRAIGAPPRLQIELRAAAESRKEKIGARKLRGMWALAGAAILLAAIAANQAIWKQRGGQRSQDRKVGLVPAQRARPEPPLAPRMVARHEEAPAATAQARNESRVRAGEVRERRTSASPLDEFVPLPVSEGLPPAAELSVVRVRLLGSDLQQYGLQTPPDAVARTMVAEFVVGEDGLPRAIRILR